MLRFFLYWIIGMVAMNVCLGVVVIAYVAYDLLYEDYAIVIYGILFIIIPVFIGVIADMISEHCRERRVNAKLKRMEEHE